MEEDIKILEEFIEAYKIAEEVLDGDVIHAIEGLIARNKELEETLKCTQNSWFEDTQKIEENKKYKIRLTDEQYRKVIDIAQKDATKDYIPKSKVIEKIEEILKILDKIPNVIVELSGDVMLVKHDIADVLQELLEG